MTCQSIFKRYEIKYILTSAQKDLILRAMAPYMSRDAYGQTTIRNIYFDTDSYRLIRHSIEKPAYKEKLRLRSYARAEAGSPVYAELKKKYDGIVYKRRISLPEKEAMDWLWGSSPAPCDSQISREIDYFLAYYKALRPVVFLSYRRDAYYSHDGSDFRVTFDDNILCRQDRLSLGEEPGGTSILEDGKFLMEIKTSGGIPLWMTQVLCREGIYKTSFSKYGTAYETLIYPNCKGDHLYAPKSVPRSV